MSELPPPPPPPPPPPGSSPDPSWGSPAPTAAPQQTSPVPASAPPAPAPPGQPGSGKVEGLDAAHQGTLAPEDRLDDRDRALDPKVVLSWRVFGGLGLLFPLGAAAVAGAFLLPGVRWLVPAISLVLLVLGVTWYPRARYDRWRWRLTDLAAELQYGVLVHRHEAVPYFRIQQIDIQQGPVDRLLNLATLQVTTASASGSAALPGIAEADAPIVRQELLQRAAEAIGDQMDGLNDAV